MGGNLDIANGFDFRFQTRLIFGNRTVERLGGLAEERGCKRVLLVTDPGVLSAGHAERGAESLRSAGAEVVFFGDVIENPTSETVECCAASVAGRDIDLIVGLGGGSAIDTAKGANFLLTNGGRIHDYWGFGKASKPMLPLFAVPTTAGTGSECQSFALISDAETHRKMACGDPKAAPAVSILDPELTLSQPRQVTAHTGMDAITHAVEAAVTKKRNPVSRMFALESFRLAQNAFPAVMAEPDNVAARGDMLLGAAHAGIAIENSMLGAAHAAANPLTARRGVVHGQAVALMLPHVVRFNGRDEPAGDLYRELAAKAGLASADAPAADAVEVLAKRLEELMDIAGMERSLAAFGVSADLIEDLARDASEQWTGKFNPRPLKPSDFAALYKSALGASEITK